MKKQKTTTTQAPLSLRQGDVLLVDASYRGGMPADATAVKPEARGTVLAHGEHTGHAHVLDRKKVKYFDAGAQRFVQIIENLAPLEHTKPDGLKAEHDAIALDRAALVNPTDGKLQQAFQVEDFGEEVRRVAD